MRAETVIGIVALGLVGCSDRPPAVRDVAGLYRAELQGTTTPARAVTLELDPGHAAEMVTEYRDGRGPIVESGTWSLRPGGEVRVVLARDGFGPVTSDVTFRWAKATLTAIAFDTVRWGARGFALVRQ